MQEYIAKFRRGERGSLYDGCMDNDEVLKSLARYPTKWILDEARRIASCGTRKATVASPFLRSPVRVKVASGPRKYDGAYYQDRRLIVVVRKPSRAGLLSTLIHEIRHAQQHDALGEREFIKLNANFWPDNPLEVDACAVEMNLAGTDPNATQRGVRDPLARRIVRILDTAYKAQAKLLRKANRRTR
jgi:hypothetical protein